MTHYAQVVQSFNMNFKRFIIAIFMLSGFVLTSIAYAQEAQQPDYAMQDIMVVNENDVINHDVFNFGDMTEIKGTVNGDVYTAGGDVVVKGQINGDVLAAGGNVQIAPGAVISQDVRVAGGKIIIDGTVVGNVTAAGGTILISDQARIAGSFTAAGSEISIQGPIGKNIKIGAKTLRVNAPIAGGADVAVQSMVFGDQGRIQGSLSYMSENEFMINEGVVAGTIQHRVPPQEFQKPEKERAEHVVGRAFAFIGLLGIIAKLFIGLLFIHVLPEFSKKASLNIRNQIWRSLGTGFLVVVLTPILIIALFSTVIAIPVAFIFLVGYVFSLYLSSIIVMLALGQTLSVRFNQKWNDGVAFSIGLFVLFVLRFVPVLGLLIAMFVTLIGVGSLVNTKIEVYKDLRKKNLL